MPNTPKVSFNFENNNLETTTPLLGVSHVVAMTTKGPFLDPSTLITSWAQFQNIFGSEVVPGGGVSNIKKALELGSTLRISRVKGTEVKKGKLYLSATPGSEVTDKLAIELTRGDSKVIIPLSIETKGYGDPIDGIEGKYWYLKFETEKINQAKTTIYLRQYSDSSFSNLISSTPFISYGTLPSTYIDTTVFINFLNNVPNINLIIGSDTAVNFTGTTIEDLKNYLIGHSNWNFKLGTYSTTLSGETELDTEDISYSIDAGDNGNNSANTVDVWTKAYEPLKEYVDGYQLMFSHIHLHVPNYWTAVLSQVAIDIADKYEIMLYVEIPSMKNRVPLQWSDLLGDSGDSVSELIGTIGYSKLIAYFTGGLKYYNENGDLVNSDCLGTVIGLGDASASEYGPWYSFAGMNRGIVPNAQGPVMENLGSPNKIDTLQKVAENNVNLFVIKDTPTYGKRTMLWHNFTSWTRQDSERFISIVRLNLYLKKNLRAILEKYLEEPNIWSTWKQIYMEAKVILDDLVDNRAMESYTWAGDQDATSFSQLQVNTEAEVRQGKYKVVLTYKDIVSLQEITIDIVIDSASSTISISEEE